MAEATATRKIARNTMFGVGAQLALKIASLLFQVYVVNRLGGEQFGQYNLVLAWAGLFSVIGDLGVVQYLQREVARDRSNIQKLFWDTVSLRLILAVVATLITVLGAQLFTDYSSEMLWGLVIFTAGYFFQALMTPLNNVLSGSERIDITSIFAVLQQILFMVMATLVLLLNLGFVWLLVVGTLNLPILLALHWWSVRRNKLGPPQFRINPALWWPIMRAAIPFGLVQLSLSFAFRADQVLLNHFHVSHLQIGWYSIAYISLTQMVLNITTSFNNAILPTLSREHVEKPDTVKLWYFRSAKMLLFIGIPVAVMGMILARQTITLLYPKELPAFVLLIVIVWDIPFYMYHSFCGNITTTIKRERNAAKIYGSLGVVNVLLNLLFIPFLGVVGSCFATVLTDFIGAVQYYFLFRRVFGPGLEFKRMARIVVAALIMGVVLYLLNGLYVPEGRSLMGLLWLSLCGVVGGAVYLGSALALGVLSAEERERVFGVVLRRLRPARS